jgi:uncharacterized protein YjiS (DUF1127 family)
MTAIDFDAVRGTTPTSRTRPPRILRVLQVMFWRHRRKKHTHLVLSRLDERFLRDIGIDPLDLRDALQNRPSTSILLEPMRRQFDDIRNGSRDTD